MSTKSNSAISTIKTTFITEVQDKRCKVVQFLVIGSDNKYDWITETKCLQIIEILSKQEGEPIDFPLKKTIQGNLDEGKDPRDGKALRFIQKDVSINIEVYTQSYNEKWKLSHTHIIPKQLFDAYMLVIKNTYNVLLSEKNYIDVENFSLGLEKAS